ncbi:MAG: hypothetical protein WC812_03690 [Candidatus Pacearchaeota archaeon]|jgi:hypothetical protein
MSNILQHPILTDFLYPFLLVFFLVFGLLQKLEILGKEKKQLDALIALVIGLIFVSVVFPKIVVSNLVLFLAVALVIVFVSLLLWGFVNGKAEFGSKMKIFLGIILFLSIVLAVIWATGFGGGITPALSNSFNFLFNSAWSGTVWGNIIIIVLVIGAILAAVGIKKKAG